MKTGETYMDTLNQSTSNAAQNENKSQNMPSHLSYDLKKYQEKLQELAGMLNVSVVSPLEESMDTLSSVWREDAAGASFLTRLTVHKEKIMEAQKQLETAIQELNTSPGQSG